MKNNLVKLFKILLAGLGFAASCTSSYKVEYGCPYGDFQLKGKVTDEKNSPINGIRVSVSANHTNPDIMGPRDTLYSKAGVFSPSFLSAEPQWIPNCNSAMSDSVA